MRDVGCKPQNLCAWNLSAIALMIVGCSPAIVSSDRLALNEGAVSKLDTTSPALVLSGPAANTPAQTGLTVTGSCEAGLTIMLSGAGIQSPASTACSPVGTFSQAITFTPGDGTKTIVLTQTDQSGNTTSITRGFVKDTLSPALVLIGPAADTPAQTGLTVTGSCEAGLNIALSGAGLQSPASTACSPVGTFSQAITFTPGDGIKTIVLTQTDQSGNTTSITRGFVKDTVSPALVLSGPAANTPAQTGLTVTGSCEAGLTIMLSGAGLQSPASTACSPVGTFSQAITFTPGDGAKTIVLTQTDQSGNSTSITRGFVKDATPPALTTIDDGSITLSLTTSPLISWAGATELGSGLLRYELSIGTAPGLTDIAGWADAGSGTTGQLSGLSLSYGVVYYTNLRAVDQLNNMSEAISGDGWQRPSPAVDTSAVPVTVPEAFPYRGQASVNYQNASPVYSLQESSCTGLNINSTTGLISGILTAVDGENCSYKVRATMDSFTAVSSAVAISVVPSMNFSFGAEIFTVRKGDPSQQLVLNLSAPAPFSSRISYSIYSDQLANEFLGELSGVSSQGYIEIPSGQSSVNFELSLPLASTLTGSTYQTLMIDTGIKQDKPRALLGLHSDPIPQFDRISTGGYHTCAIGSGRLYCWGDDTYGQLGNGPSGSVITPTQIGISTTWSVIAAGQYHTCGIDGGKLYCWGRDHYGQVGNGAATGDVSVPTQIGASANWSAVSSGYLNTCGIDGGNLYCWGRNHAGQVGTGSITADITSPALVGALNAWSAVAVGYAHGCGIESGKLYCWGSDGYGQVGNGALSGNVLSPAQIGASTTWSAVSSSSAFSTCGIDGGKLYCWGDDGYGQAGNGATTGDVLVPTQVGESSTWSSIAVGQYHVCGIDGGKLNCWGRDIAGQVGDGPGVSDTSIPVRIGISSTWTAVAGGYSHTCGIDAGRLYCWGSDGLGQVGNGGAVEKVNSPTVIGGSATWNQIQAGSRHTCGIDGGKLYCWGENVSGQVGNGTMSAYVNTPTQIGSSDSWSAITTGSSHNCGLNSGNLYCWGYNVYGQLGTGSTTDATSPVRIGTDNGWNSVAAGSNHSCGILSGKLYCWGDNYYGQLGTGSTTDSSTPVQVGVSTSWSTIAAGSYHSCGIDGGKLFCWGYDGNGQIGNGATTGNVLSPVQIGSSALWSLIKAGSNHTCGIEDGKLFCWGNDGSGQLGNGATTGNVTSPERIGISATWTAVSGGSNHSCGIDGGRLYCWGSDFWGQLGNGTESSDTTSPTPIGSSTAWSAITTGGSHTCGIDSGKLYCWGADQYGQTAKNIAPTAPLLILSRQ